MHNSLLEDGYFMMLFGNYLRGIITRTYLIRAIGDSHPRILHDVEGFLEYFDGLTYVPQKILDLI